MSYHLRKEEVETVKDALLYEGDWQPIGTNVPKLGGEYFMMSGSGKSMRNMTLDPEANSCIIGVDEVGENHCIYWRLRDGGKPASKLPVHLMNHEVKALAVDGHHHVIHHAHPANIIALIFVLPLMNEAFTRELREIATECPMVFPSGMGVVGWMVLGGRDTVMVTSRLMKDYDAAVWAHHGLSCAGEDSDLTFGLTHTIEKSAEILVKVTSIYPDKRQTIMPEDLRDLTKDFRMSLPEKSLYEEQE